VTNWPAYGASLRQRGSLTVWFTDKAIAAWAAEPRTTRGGQPWYSPLAILTALTPRAVFRLAYRQAEGLLGSVIGRSASACPCRTTRRQAGVRRRWMCRGRGALVLVLTAGPCTCWWTARA